MVHDYIKQEIPAAINEDGGASVKLVNKRTIPLDTSIKEALDGNYVIGTEQLLRANFTGLIKSMAEGVQRDGHARQLGNYLTLYAQPNGVFDLDKGWDPLVNSVSLKARLLNEMEIDISKWTFRDVTPGKLTFAFDSISTGTDAGVVTSRETIHLNCRDLPGKTALRVSWVCGDKSGDVEQAKFTSDATRIDVDASVLSTIWSSAYNNKEITFIVRGCFSTAKKTAVYKYVATPPTITKAYPNGYATQLDKVVNNGDNVIEGTNLLGAKIYKNSVSEENELATTAASTATKLVYEGCGLTAGTAFKILVANADGTAERNVTAINPLDPTIDHVAPVSEPENEGWMMRTGNILVGTNLAQATKLVFHYVVGESVFNEEMTISRKTATEIAFDCLESTTEEVQGDMILTYPNGTVTKENCATLLRS